MGFKQDPDYEYIINIFENCMKRHGFDTQNPDFFFNKNKLVLEKEAIKREMLNVINKKPAYKTDKDGKNWIQILINAIFVKKFTNIFVFFNIVSSLSTNFRISCSFFKLRQIKIITRIEIITYK